MRCTCRRVVAPRIEQCTKITRQLRIEMHHLLCYGMHKSQCLGVQCLTWAGFEAVFYKLAILVKLRATQDFIAAINIVVKEDVSNVLHMHTNLMCASRLKITLYQ